MHPEPAASPPTLPVSIQPWGITHLPSLAFPQGAAGGLLAAIYLLVLAAVLIRRRSEFTRLDERTRRRLLGLIGLGVLAAEVMVIRLPSDAWAAAFSPLGIVPLLWAGGTLGIGPAIAVGALTGLARGAWQTHRLLTSLEMALFAGAVAGMMRQDFRGRLPAALRHPLPAALLIAALFWPIHFISSAADNSLTGMAALDYASGAALAAMPAALAEAAIGGALAEALRWLRPAGWFAPSALRPPPYANSLNRRLLYSLIPLTVLAVGGLFWSDTLIAVRVARALVVDQMGRSAAAASSGLPHFLQTGRGLIKDLARAPELRDPDPLVVEHRLSLGMLAYPYFVQLVAYDSSMQPVASFPAQTSQPVILGAGERAAVELALQGVPQEATAVPTSEALDRSVYFTFVSPMVDPASGQAVGALLGRTRLNENPLVQPVIQRLQGLIAGSGEGFLIDQNGRVIYHPDPDQVLSTFSTAPSATPLVTDVLGAQAVEDRTAEGTRRLALWLPVAGHPWSVVVVVPYHVVLELAARISTPLLIILTVIGGMGLLVILFIAGRLTRPLQMLAVAAGRIAAGELDQPVRLSGEDEVGRLGLAFERMRQSLHARLDELHLLLRVSQGVASSLKLDEALPPILQSALATTGASGARVALPVESDNVLGAGSAPLAYAAGASAAVMAPLDADVLALTREQGLVVIENLSRARALLDVSSVAGRLHALLALPLQQEQHTFGALWVGYSEPHQFAESEIDFLKTLAGQAALAVANSRLFEAADSGRRRLMATLASTADPVIVTDNRNRILLLNPAAAATFGVSAQASAGRPVRDVFFNPELVRALTETRHGSGPVEVVLDGRTLYASTSPVVVDDGATLGRVCMLRDVTPLKALDALKSEFVATVSHDLRAPLAQIHAFASMLPRVGPLNPKQKEYAENIVQEEMAMTALIERLLDLGRIEAGVALDVESIRFEEVLASVVSAFQQPALNRGLSIAVDHPPRLPTVLGDKTLLQQALSNLVDNAVRYSPGGGEIRIQAVAQGQDLVVSVRDPGIGIAPADQLRVFEKFFRVRAPGAADDRGVGLGLAIVKSIVERHGGKVWAESRLGQGSTFSFQVPLDGRAG